MVPWHVGKYVTTTFPSLVCLPQVMVYRNIDPGIKRLALKKLDQGHTPEYVAEDLEVDPKSVKRWHENYELHGLVNPPSVLHGRPQSIPAPILEDLRQLTTATPSLLLAEMQRWLAINHDLPTSISTT